MPPSRVLFGKLLNGNHLNNLGHPSFRCDTDSFFAAISGSFTVLAGGIPIKTYPGRRSKFGILGFSKFVDCKVTFKDASTNSAYCPYARDDKEREIHQIRSGQMQLPLQVLFELYMENMEKHRVSLFDHNEVTLKPDQVKELEGFSAFCADETVVPSGEFDEFHCKLSSHIPRKENSQLGLGPVFYEQTEGLFYPIEGGKITTSPIEFCQDIFSLKSVSTNREHMQLESDRYVKEVVERICSGGKYASDQEENLKLTKELARKESDPALSRYCEFIEQEVAKVRKEAESQKNEEETGNFFVKNHPNSKFAPTSTAAAENGIVK